MTEAVFDNSTDLLVQAFEKRLRMVYLTQLLPAEAGRLMSRLEFGNHSKEILLRFSGL